MDDQGSVNRRAHERRVVPPMYTPVTARRESPEGAQQFAGHVYDISEGGIRIELDEPLNLGERVAMRIELPGGSSDVHAAANVMWVNDADDDPGPRRMALRFTDFLSVADRARLARYVDDHRFRAAA